MRFSRALVLTLLVVALAGCALHPVRRCANHPVLCAGTAVGIAVAAQ